MSYYNQSQAAWKLLKMYLPLNCLCQCKPFTTCICFMMRLLCRVGMISYRIIDKFWDIRAVLVKPSFNHCLLFMLCPGLDFRILIA